VTTSLIGSAPRSISSDQLAMVLSDPAAPRMVFQPIVDTRRGVVAGYEALARFDAEPFLPPDAWFAAAARYHVGAQLEARALLNALEARPTLPSNCFLSVNVSPHLLGSDEINSVLHGRDLRGVVVELTEHVPYGTDPLLLRQIATLRAAGAMIALDDAGSGYSGLQQLLAIRPEIVKLDRALIAGADQDEAKLALIRRLGEFSGQLDAWLLAEGVETVGELNAFSRLGVPLVQGWLLGRPTDPWCGVDQDGGEAILVAQERSLYPTQVGSLAEDIRTVRLPGRVGADWLGETYLGGAQLPESMPYGEPVVAVDEWRRPEALLLPVPARPGGPAYRVVRPLLRLSPGAGISESALRALARPDASRFDPVVCTDVEGRFVGMVRVERLVTRLAGQP
jgi:EAL domain-containing protein (putative c-di-GMP-specific phosphodiesterase class I)